MRLAIRAKTNKDYVMINTAKVTLPDGNILTIDRSLTEYDIDNRILVMTWQSCYLWAINNINLFENIAYLSSDDGFNKILNNGKLEFELEEDADPDYKVKVLEWEFY